MHQKALQVAGLLLLTGVAVTLTPADATAPASRAHPVSTRALCTEGERVHARVAPFETKSGRRLVGANFWITGATPGSRWGYSLEATSTNGEAGSTGTGDGVGTADENGRVEVGGAGGDFRNRNFPSRRFGAL